MIPDEHHAIIEADRLWWKQMSGVYDPEEPETEPVEDTETDQQQASDYYTRIKI